MKKFHFFRLKEKAQVSIKKDFGQEANSLGRVRQRQYKAHMESLNMISIINTN